MALITAADAAFTAHGWAGTRIEDIATAAGVSAATAYNHFPTKHALLGAVYAPHVHTLLAQAEHDIANDRPIVDAVTDQVRPATTGDRDPTTVGGHGVDAGAARRLPRRRGA